jgi:hypothetical protein
MMPKTTEQLRSYELLLEHKDRLLGAHDCGPLLTLVYATKEECDFVFGEDVAGFLALNHGHIQSYEQRDEAMFMLSEIVMS